MKKSKVLEAKPIGQPREYNGSKVYSFLIKFENKDEGFYNTTKEKQDYFVVGNECEYTIETKTGKAGKEYYSVKIPKENNQFKKFARDPEDPKRICRQNALTNAINTVVNFPPFAKDGDTLINDILEIAEVFYEWNYNGKK